MDLYQVDRPDSETTLEQDIDHTMRRLMEAIRDASHDGFNTGDRLHGLAHALSTVHEIRCTVQDVDTDVKSGAQVSIAISSER